VLAASDTKLEVRDEGARGLRLLPINLLPFEPTPLLPSPSHPSAANLQRTGALRCLKAKALRLSITYISTLTLLSSLFVPTGAGNEAMAVDEEGSSAKDAASSAEAATTAAAAAVIAAAASPPERRPDLVGLLRYAAKQVPALLPAQAFGDTPMPDANVAAGAAAVQRAGGGGVLRVSGGEGMREGGLSEDPAPMPDPARTLPMKPRQV
jgi:hypothetical protein